MPQERGAYTTPDDVELTRALLRHRNHALRRQAALAVGAMNGSPVSTMYIGDLVQLLSDETPGVRVAAAVALGQVGPSADRACVRLVQVMGCVAEAVPLREAAAVALGAIDDVTARADERVDRQARAHIEPVIDALVAVCASTSTPDVVRLAAMTALRRVAAGAWRLSNTHAGALRPLVLGERPPDEAPAAEDVRRRARDVLYPLFLEATRGHGDARLTRSTRSASASEDYGQLVL